MIARAARQLPPQMPAPPSYQKVNPATSRSCSSCCARRRCRCRRRRVRRDDDRAAHLDGQRRRAGAGVRRAEVRGARRRRSAQLAARGIGIDEVAQAIANANVNLPTGTMYGPQRTFTVQATAS
jgi:HAE1 family hydrophobic/amphiphilic exporter-1